MSIETVKNRCIKNAGVDAASMTKEEVIKLENSINKHAIRFEKVVKTAFNERRIFDFAFSLEGTYTKTKNEYFEKHKTNFIHEHLMMLCDLYDYKQPESLKKSE